tara:strand:+ start:3317 stop:4495 length:1179 start_codon:yes stop_codon:yes gene_type:complete
MYKYKFFNNIAEAGLNVFTSNDLTVDENSPDALILRSKVLTEEDLANSLRCIGRAGAGTNNIPIELATKKGIVVFNTPGANANAVKELVICGMLLASRGIIQGNIYSKSLSGQDADELNKSMESQKKSFKGNELKGKVLGIIGLGAIGSELAQAAEVMGMKIIGYDPYISIDAAWRLPKNVEKADSMEYLLNNSDYISIHVPLVEDTKDLINSESLKFFKKGSKLINLSRGGIVNNQAILEALDLNIVDKFVTDFPTPELVARSIECHDVVLLPHIGASTNEAEENCAVMAAEQVTNFLINGVITNSVNFPQIKLGRKTKYRMVVINKNEPGMLGKITDEIGHKNMNIADMTHKSRDTIGISLIDLDDMPEAELIKNIQNIDHVISVRLCQN